MLQLDMIKKIKRHGNSLGIGIDKNIKNLLDLKKGDEILFTITKLKRKKQ